MVVQFGLAMMPFGGFFASCGFTSLTTSGTSGSLRQAEELSTTTAPAAANRGAWEAGGTSIGLGIELPHEQGMNQWVNLGVNFRYFFARKTMFVKYSQGFIVRPGGFGTMDELFESATLVQTGKIRSFPVVLVGTDYWSGLVDWIRSSMVDAGMISPGDVDLLRVVDDPEEAVGLATGA